MIVWVDAQISPSIARWMSSHLGVTASAMRDLELLTAKDKSIFERARLARAVIFTKDADFLELLRRYGPPPAILWLTAGNTSNARVRALLESAWFDILERLDRGEALVEVCPSGVVPP